MYVIQYEITLPADYDMEIIRRRVAMRGHATDSFPGLGLKAYAIRERGIEGSPVNQYAPFYLWASIEGMNSFLWGEGFRGLSEDFGRPVVRQWTGLAFERGPAVEETPRVAVRRTEPIPADADPAGFIESALEELRYRARIADAHSTALAVDTYRWELVQFTIFAHADPETAGTLYKVLHLSAPHPGDIGVGRHW